ncbi:E3 ubiquitin-protein ligase arkadia-A-like [Antechinus flavipes]|uniref:E3 ubiquitin-protein ligase arkadia-A-like n=1 Tax=Antechinus flavipes TaxID=38775 RepID=UPI0022356C40|nr:E3 ubiquitin-protein ligase arkadia-A-like [Antechinus flavipes]
MVRKYKLFPEASLVQLPPKDFCQQSKFVLLPCPPHRIAPLWDQGHPSRAEQGLLKQQAPTTRSSPLPYRRAASAQLACPSEHQCHLHHHLYHRSTAIPLSDLKNYKPSSCPKQNSSASVSHLPCSYFKARSDAIAAKSSDSETLLDPDHNPKDSLNPCFWAQTPSVIGYIPKILNSHGHSGLSYFSHQLPPSFLSLPLHLCPSSSSMSSPPKSSPPLQPSSPPKQSQSRLQPQPQSPPLCFHLPLPQPVPSKPPPSFTDRRIKKQAKLPAHVERRAKTASLITALRPVCPQSASVVRGSHPNNQAKTPPLQGHQTKTSALVGCLHLQHKGRILSPSPEHHSRLKALKTTNLSKNKTSKA